MIHGRVKASHKQAMDGRGRMVRPGEVAYRGSGAPSIVSESMTRKKIRRISHAEGRKQNKKRKEKDTPQSYRNITPKQLLATTPKQAL